VNPVSLRFFEKLKIGKTYSNGPGRPMRTKEITDRRFCQIQHPSLDHRDHRQPGCIGSSRTPAAGLPGNPAAHRTRRWRTTLRLDAVDFVSLKTSFITQTKNYQPFNKWKVMLQYSFIIAFRYPIQLPPILNENLYILFHQPPH
jgi:hypothetical protein